MKEAGSRSFEIQHITVFEYEHPIQRATMLLRLEPRSDQRQQVLQFGYEIEPDTMPVAFSDPFGNKCHLLTFQSLGQSSVVVTSSSHVITNQNSATSLDDAMTWDDLASCVNKIEHWEFLQPSNRVDSSPELEKFLCNNNIQRGSNPYSSLREAALAIYQNIRYEPGSTEVTSTIQDCLEQKSGVCQDFTHIMLAIGRSWGIPSRYVSGYLHLFPDKDQIISEEASHAWGEFYLPKVGWVGIDATNDTIADNRYVRVSIGRDYDDAAPTKGVILGGGQSTLNVKITVAHKISPGTSSLLPGETQQ